MAWSRKECYNTSVLLHSVISHVILYMYLWKKCHIINYIHIIYRSLIKKAELDPTEGQSVGLSKQSAVPTASCTDIWMSFKIAGLDTDSSLVTADCCLQWSLNIPTSCLLWLQGRHTQGQLFSVWIIQLTCSWPSACITRNAHCYETGAIQWWLKVQILQFCRYRNLFTFYGWHCLTALKFNISPKMMFPLHTVSLTLLVLVCHLRNHFNFHRIIAN